MMKQTWGRRSFLGSLLLLPILGICGQNAAAQGAGGEKRLLILGDSLTAGYGLPQSKGFVPRLQAALTAAGEKVTVLNGGVSGDTSAGGLARFDWALADKPTHLVIELGANDGLRGLPPAAMEQNLDALLTRAKAARLPVLLAGMIAPPNLGREYADAFNGAYPRLAAKHAVPLYPFFLDGVAAQPALNQADGIHPNDAGVEVIVQRILPSVLDLLKQ
jgi:acyl-CoA thioesterase-1